VAACELLHALVMLMLARSSSAAVAKATDQAPNVGLYEHVLPALYRLAVDVDNVTRQLFAPLTTQIIHFFTRSVAVSLQYQQVLVETCLEGLCDRYALRGARGMEGIRFNVRLRSQLFCLRCAATTCRYASFAPTVLPRYTSGS